jgi:hypothetical protein
MSMYIQILDSNYTPGTTVYEIRIHQQIGHIEQEPRYVRAGEFSTLSDDLLNCI